MSRTGVDATLNRGLGIGDEGAKIIAIVVIGDEIALGEDETGGEDLLDSLSELGFVQLIGLAGNAGHGRVQQLVAFAGGHRQVAHGQQAHAAGHAGAIDPGHQRHGAGLGNAQQLRQVAMGFGIVGREGLGILQVGPGAKGLAMPTEHDDAQALMTGTLFVALGVLMFNHAGLLSGGTAGLALLVHYATGWAFGPVYFIVNLPFCLLAWKRMGRRFTIKTLLSAALLAVFVQWLPAGLGFQTLSAPVASVLGGLLIGLIEVFWAGYFSSEYKDVAAFCILAVVLVFMPSGILGRPEVEKV